FDVRLRRKGRNLFVDAIVPGNVGDQIFQNGKTLHWLNRDRLIKRQRIQASLAGEPRPAVDFRRARAALAGLAVPTHRETGRVMRLEVVQGVEHDHARSNRALVLDPYDEAAVST